MLACKQVSPDATNSHQAWFCQMLDQAWFCQVRPKLWAHYSSMALASQASTERKDVVRRIHNLVNRSSLAGLPPLRSPLGAGVSPGCPRGVPGVSPRHFWGAIPIGDERSH